MTETDYDNEKITLLAAICALNARIEKAELTLRKIGNLHQSYDRTRSIPYEIGVTDGHRCAAKLVREYMEECNDRG